MANLTVTMAEEDWMKVLTFLAKIPFEQSAPLIMPMQRQLQMQAEQAQRDAPKTNGYAEHSPAPGA